MRLWPVPILTSALKTQTTVTQMRSARTRVVPLRVHVTRDGWVFLVHPAQTSLIAAQGDRTTVIAQPFAPMALARLRVHVSPGGPVMASPALILTSVQPIPTRVTRGLNVSTPMVALRATATQAGWVLGRRVVTLTNVLMGKIRATDSLLAATLSGHSLAHVVLDLLVTGRFVAM